MTPLEEAVARVISGFDVGLGDDFRLVDAIAHARKEKSLVNASAILDELSRAILALPEIVKMQGAQWQPIETAPKDATKILVSSDSLWQPEAAPEGFTLVPNEITLEMQKAYFDVVDANLDRVESDASFGRFASQKQAYRAMLTSAPTPASAGVGKE